MDVLTISAETPDQPAIRAFFAASDAYAASLYPAESNHLLDVFELLRPNVRFFVARRSGQPVGCGALVREADDWGEVKRMWVDPAARGLGAGRRILATLLEAGRAERLAHLRLETGIHNAEALGLYHRAGFVEIAAFGKYKPDPLSVFMELAL